MNCRICNKESNKLSVGNNTLNVCKEHGVVSQEPTSKCDECGTGGRGRCSHGYDYEGNGDGTITYMPTMTVLGRERS